MFQRRSLKMFVQETGNTRSKVGSATIISIVGVSTMLALVLTPCLCLHPVCAGGIMVTNRAAVSCCKHKEMLSVNKTNMRVLKYLAEGIPTKYLRTECRLIISHESDSCVGMQVPFGKDNDTHLEALACKYQSEQHGLENHSSIACSCPTSGLRS
jgi:hypothetical protein